MQRLRSIPRWLLWLRGLLCLSALLSAAALRGRGYVACAMDGALHFSACCVVAAGDGAPAVDDEPCCTHHDQAEAEAAPASSAPEVVGVVPLGITSPPLVYPPSPRQAGVPGPRAPPPRYLQRAGPAPPPRMAARLARLSILSC